MALVALQVHAAALAALRALGQLCRDRLHQREHTTCLDQAGEPEPCRSQKPLPAHSKTQALIMQHPGLCMAAPPPIGLQANEGDEHACQPVHMAQPCAAFPLLGAAIYTCALLTSASPYVASHACIMGLSGQAACHAHPQQPCASSAEHGVMTVHGEGRSPLRHRALVAIQAHHHVDIHQCALEQGVIELVAHCRLQHHHCTIQLWTASLHGCAAADGQSISQVHKQSVLVTITAQIQSLIQGSKATNAQCSIRAQARVLFCETLQRPPCQDSLPITHCKPWSPPR